MSALSCARIEGRGFLIFLSRFSPLSISAYVPCLPSILEKESMCMDQVVETECTQDAADSDEEAHEDKEPVMGGDPEDAPKKYTEKADCTDGNQLCEKWFWHKVPSFNMYEM